MFKKGVITVGNGKRYRLYCTAFVVHLAYLSTGCVISWPGPSLPLLSECGYTDHENSLIAAFSGVGAALGSLSLSYLTAWLGRKSLLLLNGGLYFISWAVLMVYLPHNVSILCLGRFLGGYAIAVTFSMVPVYLAEISPSDVRQAVTSPVEVFIGSGFLLQFLFGAFFNYRQIQACNMGVTAVFFLCFLGAPQSPYDLVSLGRTDMASVVISKLWNRDIQRVGPFITEIQMVLSINEGEGRTGKVSELWRVSGYRRAVLVILLVICTQKLAVMNAMQSYSGVILDHANVPRPLWIASVSLAGFFALSSLTAPFLVKRLGSKTVLVSAFLTIALSQIVIAVYVLLRKLHFNIGSLYPIPLVAIMMYFAAFSIGAGPLPWSVMAELSPARHRSTVVSLCSVVSWSISSVLLGAFQSWYSAVGLYSVLFTLAAGLIVGSVLIGFSLPETSSLSLNDIDTQILDRRPIPISRKSSAVPER